MLKRNATVIVVLALGFVLGYGTLAFTQDKKQGAPPLRQIHAAAKALEQAENHLQKVEHHFGGHRAKALDLVKQAEAELKQAVEYAKANAPAATPPAVSTPAPATPAPKP
jgi:uncharacterized radical SAM superfamily Fe-S cluster-containing enzyme